MNTSLNAERSMIKFNIPSQKIPERPRTYFNIIKAVFQSFILSIIRNRKKSKLFLLTSGIRQRCPHYPYLFNIVLWFLAKAVRQLKII